ncbi:MAG: hypothetical protein CYG60_12945, partial [Actinobacteria bacterium]
MGALDSARSRDTPSWSGRRERQLRGAKLMPTGSSYQFCPPLYILWEDFLVIFSKATGRRAVAEYLKLPDVARQLGVSEKTARRYVKSGALPSVFLGGAYRVREADLEKFLEGARVEPGKVAAPPSPQRSFNDVLAEERRPLGPWVRYLSRRLDWYEELFQRRPGEFIAPLSSLDTAILFAVNVGVDLARIKDTIRELEALDPDAEEVHALTTLSERLADLEQRAAATASEMARVEWGEEAGEVVRLR